MASGVSRKKKKEKKKGGEDLVDDAASRNLELNCSHNDPSIMIAITSLRMSLGPTLPVALPALENKHKRGDQFHAQRQAHATRHIVYPHVIVSYDPPRLKGVIY